ncbi:hypothetical protein PUV54_01405 [Hyphococcus flavus]|uniref:Intradiol ring-cleavage dioxygenases domain-containing protein n=1 Tax=Hyphococcus flavus TaxID=1866326 RepID=A0AAF0CG67_9PROT|nr:hypothetical protein [Hyphococcus flavus]WDI31843.1 hypothetical protein PUV54_01405 [Hyphococcus flavus]
MRKKASLYNGQRVLIAPEGKQITRRSLLGTSVGAAALADQALAKTFCASTLVTEPGPFFPVKNMNFAADLAGGHNGGAQASGKLLYVYGVVRDGQCQPVQGARVAIWQADAEGHYDHPRAEGHDDLDPNFQYFGEIETSETGFYRFRTIQPKSYVAFGLNRAAHIHFRIAAPGVETMTTEMYFAGAEHDERRMNDVVWSSRPAPARESLIVESMLAVNKSDLGVEAEPGALACRFDIGLT